MPDRQTHRAEYPYCSAEQNLDQADGSLGY